jgi:hypothetical protein
MYFVFFFSIICWSIGLIERLYTDHYDNPQQISGQVDDSGFRLYMTDSLRPLLAGKISLFFLKHLGSVVFCDKDNVFVFWI